MTTHVTFKPHYCDRRYGEYVSDRIYHMKLFGIPRNLPLLSSALVGKLNSYYLPNDSSYLCNGAFELYPVYYKAPKRAKVVTMMKELTFWKFSSLPMYKQKFLKKLFSINTGIITDTFAMKSMVQEHIDTQIEIVNPFCAQPFLKNKPDLSAKKIIFIGSFESPNKGYNELVQAFKLLNAGGDWRLFMVGKRGTEFVKENVSGVEITNHVRSLKPYLSKCSIYVHPAHFEPFGITVLEAMSAGVIPIVTRMTGVSEVLDRNGMKNLIVPDNNPETLAQKIEEVYNYSSAKKRKMSNKCKSIVKSRYLEKTGLEDFRKAFEKIS